MKAELRNHASALGRHGAKKRWSNTNADERSRVMEIVRKGKAKRAREGKQGFDPDKFFDKRRAEHAEALPFVAIQ